MAKENYMINRKKRILFYILMAAVLCWFVVLQIFGTNERDKKTIEQNILYQGTFVWEKSDGSREQIEVPGRYELSAKETMVLVTQLPEDYDAKSIGDPFLTAGSPSFTLMAYCGLNMTRQIRD